MKDQTNQKSKTTIVILTLQSSFECILAQFREYRHLRVMGTVDYSLTEIGTVYTNNIIRNYVYNLEIQWPCCGKVKTEKKYGTFCIFQSTLRFFQSYKFAIILIHLTLFPNSNGVDVFVLQKCKQRNKC